MAPGRGPGVPYQEKPEAGGQSDPPGVVVQDWGGGWRQGAGSPGIDDCADPAGRPLCLRELRQPPRGERLQQMVSGVRLDARDPLLHPHPSSTSSRAPALPPMDGCGPAAAPRPHPPPRSLGPSRPLSPGPLTVAPACLGRDGWMDGSDVHKVS